MGGAQPLAATMAGASLVAVECQPSRIEFRLKTGYLDTGAATIDEALAIIDRARKDGKPVSVGLLGNAAELYPEILQRGIRPDVVTDQTSAHDPSNGYLPAGWTLEQWADRRERDPAGVAEAARRSMARQVEAMLAFHREGIPVLDYGNNIRQMAAEAGLKGRLRLPGLRPGLCPAAVLPRQGAVPLGRAVGRPGRHLPHRRGGEGAAARRHGAAQLARHGARADRIPGPAGADLLARARRARPGGARLQRTRADGRGERADRYRPRPYGFGLGGEPPTARPRGCSTARTRSPTGRS